MEEKKSFLKQKIDLESPNRNIVPITTSIEEDGKLSVGGCSIEELVKKYDSPLYILDEITLRKSCRAYKQALEKFEIKVIIKYDNFRITPYWINPWKKNNLF